MGWLTSLGLSSTPSHPPGPRREPDVILPDGDLERGSRLFKLKCGQCHTIHSEGINKQGPCLWRVLGRRAGQVQDFEYTDANRTSEITWSEKHLFKYIENPRKYIPGTRMAFLGIKDEQERADVVAFVKAKCAEEAAPSWSTEPGLLGVGEIQITPSPTTVQTGGGTASDSVSATVAVEDTGPPPSAQEVEQAAQHPPEEARRGIKTPSTQHSHSSTEQACSAPSATMPRRPEQEHPLDGRSVAVPSGTADDDRKFIDSYRIAGAAPAVSARGRTPAGDATLGLENPDLERAKLKKKLDSKSKRTLEIGESKTGNPSIVQFGNPTEVCVAGG